MEILSISLADSTAHTGTQINFAVLLSKDDKSEEAATLLAQAVQANSETPIFKVT
jgi:hypothetical protein